MLPMSLFLGNMGIIGEQLGTSTLLAASVGIKNVDEYSICFTVLHTPTKGLRGLFMAFYRHKCNVGLNF